MKQEEDEKEEAMEDQDEIFPQQKKKSSKTGLILALILVFLVFGGLFLYVYLKNRSNPNPLPSPSAKIKTTASPQISPSLSLSPKIPPTISPTKSGAELLIPASETLELSSQADTNGDLKDETLVITKKSNGKYHAYILSFEKKILYDNQDLGQKPLRIATQIYNPSEKYLSWMLVFTELSGNLAFIHWNGQNYEIPVSDLGI